MKRLNINYNLRAMDVLVSMARYNFVIRSLQDSSLKVLDFGCGSGYGTKILSEVYDSVIGFDTYPDEYIPKDFDVRTDLNTLPSNHFDIVTCFEVIEHMVESDQEKLMNSLQSLINPDGSLFISTVRKIDPAPTENRRKEHLRELTYDQLYQFCRTRFKSVYTFGQIDQHITTFYPENHYHFVFICTHKR